MTTATSESFTKALDKFRQRLSDKQKQAFSFSNQHDVELAIADIQDRLVPDKRLRLFRRIKKFLEGMEQLEKVVKVFLNVHEVVAFIWGPIKLVLVIAATKTKCLDMLLGTYQDIGGVLHGLDKYERLFREHQGIREILEIYFYDVLEFHHEVLKAFTTPTWKRFFKTTWPTFKTNFEPILENLRRHQALLSDEKIMVILDEVQTSRKSIDSVLMFIKKQSDDSKRDAEAKKKDSQRQLIREQKAIVETKLDPIDYTADQNHVYSQRHKASSGDWIFQDPKFIAWSHEDSPVNGILYLSGILGSGKTVLVSRIVSYMDSQKTIFDGRIIFFYFKDSLNDVRHRNMADMLRALLAQLLEQDDALVAYMHQKVATLAGSKNLSEETLKELAQDCLEAQKKVWIILDGLDECSDKLGVSGAESRRVLNWLQKEILDRSLPSTSHIRILISGQKDGHIDTMLRNYPRIDLEMAKLHIKYIESYIRSEASKIKERFRLDENEETKLVKDITDAAKGMFLYTKVVLTNLQDQGTITELKEELMQKNFPDDLKKAYDRVAIRVFDRGTLSKRKAAARILGWVISSGRPLRWREIQSLLCIEPEKGICLFENRRLDDCKTICGSLVEVENCEQYANSISEQIIDIVHPTAIKYLFHTGRISLLNEHAKFTIFCNQYLSSNPLTEGFPVESVENFGAHGYYGLLDYVTVFWQHHMRSFLNTEGDVEAEIINTAIDCAKSLLQICNNTQNIRISEQKDNAVPLTREELTSAIENINMEHLVQKWAYKALRVRICLEAINLDSLHANIRRVCEELNGPLRYKCSKTQCSRFTTGFSSLKQRDVHFQEHQRPFKCQEAGYPSREIGFVSRSLLESHVKRLHTTERVADIFARVAREKIHKVSSLSLAAQYGDLEALKKFHRLGHDITSSDSGNNMKSTPIILAARSGHASICEYLTKNGADPYKKGRGNNTALDEIMYRRDIDIYNIFRHNTKERTRDHILHELKLAFIVGWEHLIDEILSDSSTFSVKNNLKSIWQSISHAGELGYGSNDMGSYQEQYRIQHRIIQKAFPTFYALDTDKLRKDFRQTGKKEDINLIDLAFFCPEGLLREFVVFSNYSSVIIDFLLDFATPNHLIIEPSETLLHLLAKRDYWRTNDKLVLYMENIVKKLLQLDNGATANMEDSEGKLPVEYMEDEHPHRMAILAYTKTGYFIQR